MHVMNLLKNKFIIPVLFISILVVLLVLGYIGLLDILILVFLVCTLVIIGYFYLRCIRSIDFIVYEEVKKAESVEEGGRAIMAKEKFKTPLLGHMLRWMYREGWFYSIAVILLILIGIFLRFYALGDFDFVTDEYFHFSTGVGYMKTGEFVRWNFLADSPGEEYKRAWPFTWQVAQSFKIYGVSLFSGRLISFFWGILFLPLVYPITKRITDSRKVAILTLLLISTSPYLIFLSRWMRMYQMFVVLFFVMVYFFYIGFEYQHTEKVEDNRLMKWFYRRDINPLYISISAILFFIALNVHILSLFFLLGIAFYSSLMFYQKFSKSRILKFDKYLAIIVLSLIAFIFLLFFYLCFEQGMPLCIELNKNVPLHKDIDKVVDNAISYSSTAVYRILDSLSSYPSFFIGVFFINGLIYGFLRGSKILLYYSSFILSSSLYIIFFLTRPLDPRYMSEVIPFGYLFASIGFIGFMEFFSSKIDAKRRRYLWLAFAIFIILSSSTMLLSYENLDLMGGYVESNGRSDFKTVSEYLGENYREGEIVLDLAPKDYYLKDYKDKNIELVYLHSRLDDLHEDILDYQGRYESGWLIFEDRKYFYFREETLQYIKENLDYVEELNGTNINVYRW